MSYGTVGHCSAMSAASHSTRSTSTAARAGRGWRKRARNSIGSREGGVSSTHVTATSSPSTRAADAAQVGGDARRVQLALLGDRVQRRLVVGVVAQPQPRVLGRDGRRPNARRARARTRRAARSSAVAADRRCRRPARCHGADSITPDSTTPLPALPSPDMGATNAGTQLIDLSHRITEGMVTYPGLPVPDRRDPPVARGGRAAVRAGYHVPHRRSSRCARTPAPISTCRSIATRTVTTWPGSRSNGWRRSPPSASTDAASPPSIWRPMTSAGLAGHAVLVRTDHSVHFGTDAYMQDHPHLSAAVRRGTRRRRCRMRRDRLVEHRRHIDR